MKQCKSCELQYRCDVTRSGSFDCIDQLVVILTTFANLRSATNMGWQTTITLARRSKGCHLITDVSVLPQRIV